ncbi:MAG: DUF4139 domain-containing protein [Pirellulaceae bacterium]
MEKFPARLFQWKMPPHGTFIGGSEEQTLGCVHPAQARNLQPARHPSVVTLAMVAVACSLLFPNESFGQLHSPDAVVDAGVIESVTVYRDTATVVRKIKVPAKDELQRVVVPNLPSGLIASSTYANGDAETTVRWLRLAESSSRPTEEDPKLMQLDSQHQQLQQEATEVENMIRVVDQDLLTVERMASFSSSKVQQNLDRSTLDVSTVTSLTDFVIKQRRELADELFQLNSRSKQLAEQIRQNRFERGEQLEHRFAPFQAEALMAVDSPQGGWVRLAYRVDGVSWQPSYTIRGYTVDVDQAADSKFMLQLSAAVTQNSGEDWRDVHVTFSTSQPHQQAVGPSLTPLRVRVAPKVSIDMRKVNQPDTQPHSRAKAPQWQDPEVWQRDIDLNTSAAVQQIDEWMRSSELAMELANDAGSEATDESYRILKPIDLDNRSGIQTVVIAEGDLSGQMYHMVTPLLSSFAYREAKIENKLSYNLVAAAANVFLDDQFIGKATVPPTVIGQSFLVGFGPDRQLRTRRELLSQKESVVGGNRQTQSTYRLVVSNFHPHAVDIRLLDRMPVAADDGSMTVSLDEDAIKSLSSDPLYQRMRRPKGVLRWDLAIPPRRFGSDAFDFEYSLTMEIDRENAITTGSIPQQIEDDYHFFKNNSGMGGGMGGGGSF